MLKRKTTAYKCNDSSRVCIIQTAPHWGQRGQKALRVAAIIGAGAGTVFLAFAMAWIISL
ncbi:MAG: hypothetical protein ACE5IC_08205 [Candidatus Brocadiales bacterium]